MNVILRILQVLRPATGGMLGHVELLLSGLNEKGHDIIVACPVEEKSLHCLKAAGVFKMQPLDTGDDLRPWLDSLTIGKFARFLDANPFDIIHAHGAKAGLITRLALHLGRRQRSPVIVSYHNEISPPSRQGYKRQVRRHAERLLKKDTAHFIAVSPSIQRELIEEIGCPPQKVSFIPNGIYINGAEQTKLPIQAWSDWPEDVFIVSTVARLTWEKGVDVLLEGFARAVKVEPRLRLVIVGDGPQGVWLRERIAAEGLGDQVRLLGYVENARSLLGAFDAFALPSRTEGWPLSIMEAMAAGLPVVASGVGGIPELVLGGQCGILVEPGEVNQLKDALVDLARDPIKARKLGQKAALHARKHFSAQIMVDRVHGVYQAIIGNGRGT